MISGMNSIESTSPSASFYIGHIRNGVVVFGVTNPSLAEGQAVRVEPVSEPEIFVDNEHLDRTRQLQVLFEQWTEEDFQLLPEEADRLRVALEESPGLTFRPPDSP